MIMPAGHICHKPASGPIPALAGIGLKPEHYADLLTRLPAIGFLEVHTENYMGDGGPPHRYLTKLREHYPLSFHGVGMSLGGVSALDQDHLHHWKMLIDRYQPALISEHIAWSAYNGSAFHDLLPLPYTTQALDVLCRNISRMQDTLGRRILIENPAGYLPMDDGPYLEAEFLIEAAQRTGCGLLLDINNIYVTCMNLDQDPGDWIDTIPASLIGEIHLAGHVKDIRDDNHILIDNHGAPVCDEVLALYVRLIKRTGYRPTLIERDTDIPPLSALLSECERVNALADTLQAERQA